MKTSAKWTAVTFLAATALGAAAFAFSGCTVGSGTVNDDGSTGTPPTTPPGTPPGTPPSGDGGATCEGNTQDTTKADFGADCQACLDENCCTELKNCFNQTAGTLDGGVAAADCNDYAKCILFCNNEDAGDPATCEQDCDTATTSAISTSYNDILTCGKDKGCATRCGIQ